MEIYKSGMQFENKGDQTELWGFIMLWKVIILIFEVTEFHQVSSQQQNATETYFDVSELWLQTFTKQKHSDEVMTAAHCTALAPSICLTITKLRLSIQVDKCVHFLTLSLARRKSPWNQNLQADRFQNIHTSVWLSPSLNITAYPVASPKRKLPF